MPARKARELPCFAIRKVEALTLCPADSDIGKRLLDNRAEQVCRGQVLLSDLLLVPPNIGGTATFPKTLSDKNTARGLTPSWTVP